MSSSNSTLAAANVVPHLSGRFGEPYLYEAECASTQQLLLGADLAEGAIAVTEHQTAGRGRMGRSWEAPPGTSILLSVLLRPPAGRRLQELALVGGLAAAEAIEGVTDLGTALKWPNDVLIDGKKVAGLLAEARDGAVVIGIGINANQVEEDLPTTPIVPATSLRLLAEGRVDRAALLATLLDRLEVRYRSWVADGLGGLQQAIDARDFLRDREVVVDGARATAAGIDVLGRLRVVTRTGERRLIESGEVTLAPSS